MWSENPVDSVQMCCVSRGCPIFGSALYGEASIGGASRDKACMVTITILIGSQQDGGLQLMLGLEMT